MPISRETQPAEGATPSEGASSARARTPAFAVTFSRGRPHWLGSRSLKLQRTAGARGTVAESQCESRLSTFALMAG